MSPGLALQPLPGVISEGIMAALVARAAATPHGPFAELGVYKGGSAWRLAHLARAQRRDLWLFDTFTGIPFADEIDRHRVGDFGDASLEAVRDAIPDALIVPGVFPASLEGIELPRFAFVHVDADQYRSVRSACEVFGPRMLSGGLIWFDDYDLAGTPGATRAVDECYPGRAVPDGCGRSFVRFA